MERVGGHEDVVLNTDHVVLANGFPETEYLRASAIFVSGTSDIPPNLNYRSVSPINVIIICKKKSWDKIFKLPYLTTYENTST